jgi:hypothetical protein
VAMKAFMYRHVWFGWHNEGSHVGHMTSWEGALQVLHLWRVLERLELRSNIPLLFSAPLAARHSQRFHVSTLGFPLRSLRALVHQLLHLQ